jgi:hypothetical protein
MKPVVLPLLSFLLLLAIVHSIDPTNVLDVPYNIVLQSFGDVSPIMYRQLISYTPNPPSILGRAFLAPRRAEFNGKPDKFVMLNMVSDIPIEKATLAFCQDDVYSMGFKNLSGHWLIMKSFYRVVPLYTKLPFGHSYPELLPPLPGTTNNNQEVDSHLRLVTVRLGREATAIAFSTLAHYNPHTTTDAAVKSAVLTLSVTFGEGLRFTKLNTRLVKEWDAPGGVYMTLNEARSVVLFGAVSHQLDWWWADGDRRKGVWRTDWMQEMQSIDANSHQKARDTLLLLLSYRPSPARRTRVGTREDEDLHQPLLSEELCNPPQPQQCIYITAGDDELINILLFIYVCILKSLITALAIACLRCLPCPALGGRTVTMY